MEKIKKGETVMIDKWSLTYKNNKLKVMLGKKELSLNYLVDPAIIVLSANELPTLRFEVILDSMAIDDMKAFGKYIKNDSSAGLPKPNKPDWY